MARLDVSHPHWETYTLGTSSLRPWQRQKRKIKNFPFLAFRTHWISPMVKCALHVISGKAERVSTSDDTTIKNSKTFLPWLQAPHKNPKRKNRAKRIDLIFVSRMRNAEACITENHHELASEKNQKKGIWGGAKWGFLGCFSLCIYY